MEGKRLIRSLRLRNFLSYGPDSPETELLPLNVLIGPNASGKSNLIEALDVLRAAPTDLTVPIRQGGGVAEWLWKGGEGAPVAEVEAVVDYPPGPQALRYRLAFAMEGQRFALVDEVVEELDRRWPEAPDVYFFYRYQSGQPVLNVQPLPEQPGSSGREQSGFKRYLRREDIKPEQSVLSQIRDPDQYPEVTYVGREFGRIRLYREWNLGRNTEPRKPQKADLPEDFLEEDAANLALVLNDLQHRPGAKEPLLRHLETFYDAAKEVTTRVHGGTVQLFLHEEWPTAAPIVMPATRLSDGTLRWLCLLSILCHPEPPPLVCIEEPELGLHPDVIRTIGELLIDASQRTQLIVTTHSEVLVSALTEIPEAVLVCERDGHGTSLRRLDSERLKDWLQEYTLGELWTMGELGGTL